MTDVMTNQWRGMSTATEALPRRLQASVAMDCKDMRNDLKGMALAQPSSGVNVLKTFPGFRRIEA